MKSAVLIALAFFAHHSLSGTYDTSASITLEGTIREFQFVNPHPYLSVEVSRAGKTRRWKMEMDNRYELTQIGMTKGTFKNGDKVTISGSPGRHDEPILYIRRLDRATDGFWYEQVGTDPKTGRTINR